MSPTLLAALRRIDAATRRLHFATGGWAPAVWPRDYYRPAEQLRRDVSAQLAARLAWSRWS